MGYSYYRDCGDPRVFSLNQNECVEKWRVEECGVTTSTTHSTTKSNTCNQHNNCNEDGVFAEGPCKSTFCQCWHGYGWVMECMEPLKFDLVSTVEVA